MERHVLCIFCGQWATAWKEPERAGITFVWACDDKGCRIETQVAANNDEKLGIVMEAIRQRQAERVEAERLEAMYQ